MVAGVSIVQLRVHGPQECKILINTGNHDITLDQDFYMNHGQAFHNKELQSTEACLSLFKDSSSITYLYHDSATIRLKRSDGPHTEFKAFGSPYSIRHGLWAFGYDAPSWKNPSTELTPLWELIPLETDIVVTHTPPKTHCDVVEEPHRPRGCEALRRALWRVRPRLAVCGHLHQGRGAELIKWELTSETMAFTEAAPSIWQDPSEGNNKLSLVDLTGKKGPWPKLENDGAIVTEFWKIAAAIPGVSGRAWSCITDTEAILGREGRMETCVVNAAIMKSKYPHVGGKQFNKPIVVDIELPVWEDDSTETVSASA